MLCSTCKKKGNCTVLCEKAENFVNQDHVSQKEAILPHGVSENYENGEWPRVLIKGPAHLKELIIALHDDGKSSREIAYHLPCSHVYVRRVVLTSCRP